MHDGDIGNCILTILRQNTIWEFVSETTIKKGCSSHSAKGEPAHVFLYPIIIHDDQTHPKKSVIDDIKQASFCHILQHRGNKKAVVIANGQQRVEEALEAGCDAIEQGYAMGEDNLREMVKKNILWIPSVLRARNSLDASSAGGDVCCRFSQRYVAPGQPIPGAEAF